MLIRWGKKIVSHLESRILIGNGLKTKVDPTGLTYRDEQLYQVSNCSQFIRKICSEDIWSYLGKILEIHKMVLICLNLISNDNDISKKSIEEGFFDRFRFELSMIPI
jgi:hypothetical protein